MAVTTDAAAQDLAILARNLRDAGETGLRRDLVKGIKDAADTIPPVVRRQLPGFMPAQYAAVLNPDLDMGTSVHTSVGAPGVSVYVRPRGRRKRKLPRLDRGILTHPLFGDRQHWYDQTDGVRPGFFSGPVEDAVPRVRADMEAAIERVKDQLWEGV